MVWLAGLVWSGLGLGFLVFIVVVVVIVIYKLRKRGNKKQRKDFLHEPLVGRPLSVVVVVVVTMMLRG